MNVPKLVVILTWLFATACLFVESDSIFITGGRVIFWLLAVAHVIECFVFLPKLKAAGGSLPTHILLTLVFGILHANELEAAAGE
jgi:hypothetical protein